MRSFKSVSSNLFGSQSQRLSRYRVAGKITAKDAVFLTGWCFLSLLSLGATRSGGEDERRVTSLDGYFSSSFEDHRTQTNQMGNFIEGTSSPTGFAHRRKYPLWNTWIQKGLPNNELQMKETFQALETPHMDKSLQKNDIQYGLELAKDNSETQTHNDRAVTSRFRSPKRTGRNRQKRTGKTLRGSLQRAKGKIQREKIEHMTQDTLSNFGQLELVDGVYDGLTVKITDKISLENCQDVVKGLQIVLDQFSSTLYTASKKRAALGKVNIILPKTWSNRPCHPLDIAISSNPQPTSSPHIIIDAPHALFGDYPWSQQTSGCFRRGNFIKMGVEFLKEANSSTETAKQNGRILAGEWAKFRWGVFSEAGHPRDPLYPPWFLEDHEWAPTVCSNVPSHSPPCLLELAHRCTWPPKSLSNASSSLLSMPSFPHVSSFCTARDHNQRAPTKHNALCRGRSAWEVISASPDFRGGKNPPQSGPRPKLKLNYLKDSSLRFVLLVESTGVMNEQRRWEFVRKAVRRTVVYDLPDEAEVAVVVFNKEPTEVAPLAKLESMSDLRERVGSSLPRNPSSVGSQQACMKCAFKAAIKALKQSDAGVQGANVVLITDGGQSRANDATEIQDLVKSHGLRLLLVLYPFQEYPGYSVAAHSFIPITHSSGGSVFTVMDEGVGHDSKVSMLIALMEVLKASIAAGGATTPVLVHFATYPGGVAPQSEGTFSLDDSLASKARFSVYYYDLTHVGNAIHLTAPSGSTIASVSNQEEDGDVNMIFVNLHNAERGVWRYKVENRADSHQGLHIQVTSLSNPANDVTVRVWTNQIIESFMTSQLRQPIIIYGEVQVNGAPVIGAGVLATLQRLGVNATGGTYPPVDIPLLDLGTGDPDITGGDGIYSRYSPPLDGPARYALMLSVDANRAVIGHTASSSHNRNHDIKFRHHASPREGVKKSSSTTSSLSFGTSQYSTSMPSSSSYSPYSYHETSRRIWENGGVAVSKPTCCGSVLQYPHTRQAPPFTRQVTGPTVEVFESHSTRIDTTPPARIVDLMALVNVSTGRVMLQWTSVGGNHDWGRAHHYEGAYSNSIRKAYECFGDPIQGLPEPAPATTRQSAIVNVVFFSKKTVFVCIRAVDKAGNKGSPSNAAAIRMPRPPAIDGVAVQARGPGYGSYGSSGVGEKVAVISGCIGGVLLVLVLVAAYCYCVPPAFRKRLKSRRGVALPILEDKNADIQGNLANGGSLVMKSSTGKTTSFVSNGTDNPRLKDPFAKTSIANSPDDAASSNARDDCEGGSQETLRLTLDNDTLGANGSNTYDGKKGEKNDRRGLSMSIPDVTRVDQQCSNPPAKEQQSNDSHPQFFTLGRRTKQKPIMESCSMQPEFQQRVQRPHSSSHKPAPPPVKPRRPPNVGTNVVSGQFFNSYRPTTPPHHRRQSMHESDSSLYGEGSQEGDSITGVLCDDRTASPPPPAPSGPDKSSHTAFQFKRHSLNFP